MNHVIHYHLPSKEDEFTHRNGRTARMLSTGTAYVIAHESEKNGLYQWNGSFKWKGSLPKPPEFQTILYQWWKENKLNKIDIVGFSQKGKLEKGDLGLIEVKDFISLQKFNKVKDFLHNIQDEK
jgi:superfamily II DNA/RNA helicase